MSGVCARQIRMVENMRESTGKNIYDDCDAIIEIINEPSNKMILE